MANEENEKIPQEVESELTDKDLTGTVGGGKVSAFASFLKIDGIDGESTDDKHKGEIQLESYTFRSTT